MCEHVHEYFTRKLTKFQKIKQQMSKLTHTPYVLLLMWLALCLLFASLEKMFPRVTLQLQVWLHDLGCLDFDQRAFYFVLSVPLGRYFFCHCWTLIQIFHDYMITGLIFCGSHFKHSGPQQFLQDLPSRIT